MHFQPFNFNLSVADYSQLVAGVAAGTEVHVLDPVQDAVTQITHVLLGREGITSLHVVSHGEAGGLDFGSSRLNLSDLPEYAAQSQSWGQALTDDADILLYGCDVAAGELGQASVQMLGQLIGADVAASDDLTGSGTLGGDWNLEFNTGSVEFGLAFSQSVQAGYTGILPSFAATNFTVGTNPFSVAIGDFNGDGKADIAAANYGSNTVSVLLGNGSGSFAAATNFTVGTNPNFVAIGDFNGDGKADIAAANVDSDNASVLLNNPPSASLTIADNTPPTLDLNGAAAGINTTASFTEGSGAVALVASTLSLTDDNPTLASATVTIANLLDGSLESLDATVGSTGISKSYTAGVLTLSGSSSVSNYQQVLRTVTYNNTSPAPATTSRTINFVVNDGANSSPVAITTLSLTAINNLPTITAPASVTVAEDLATAITGISFADLDAGAAPVTATFSVATGTLSATASGGVTIGGSASALTLAGTIANLNAFIAANSLTYTTLLDSNTALALGVSLNDNGNSLAPAQTASTNVTLNVAPVNDRPSFTPVANQATTAGAKAQTVANFTSFNPGVANEAGQTATYAIVTNSNPGLFTGQPTIAPNGTLVYTPVSTLTTAQTATITLQVQDNGGTANGGIDTSTTQSFTITVNPSATPPIITPPVTPPVTPPIVVPPVTPPVIPPVTPSAVIPIFTVFQLRQTFTLNRATQKLLAAQPSNTVQQLFDEAFYLRQNPDVYAAYARGVFQSGFQHFLQYGQYEGRNPSSLFDEQFYLSQNLDVAIAVSRGNFRSGFQHFLSYGQFEGRNFCRVYNEQTYLAQNSDVAIAVARGSFRSGFQHFLQFGFAEGRLSNLTLFNESYYLSQNPDVAAAVARGQFKNGLHHFELYGQREGRQPSTLFNESYYLSQNPDVAALAAASGYQSTGFDHYLALGRFEGRRGVA